MDKHPHALQAGKRDIRKLQKICERPEPGFKNEGLGWGCKKRVGENPKSWRITTPMDRSALTCQARFSAPSPTPQLCVHFAH